MSALLDQAGDYLRLRRALGHNLDQAHRLLPDFVAYLDAIGAEKVTVEAALVWAQRPDADPATSVWARRMTVARGFARHMTGVDPDTEIPPLGLVRFRQRRRPPFIYSAADITALMSVAQAGKHDLLHLDRRHPALRRGLRQDVPEAAPGDRRRGRGTTPSQGPRHAPQLCCAHPGQVVSRRRGRRRAHAAAIYVSGSPGRVLHLLVPLGRTRAAGPGCRAPGS